ncbi:MAG: hypothetical protein LUI39_05795, partial [Lachnospiraceae bacterium]|nr:hypothetical protein [Lachnospiraceae bacterium]
LIGRGPPEFTPVEIVGYEVDEAGSQLASDNGQFTQPKKCFTMITQSCLMIRNILQMKNGF